MSEAVAQRPESNAPSAVPPSAALRAVPRSGWHLATVASTRRETPNASRLELDVDGWPGNAAGQHLDVRLTAPDGYTATRSYSIASSGTGTRVTLAVDKLPDGEVSPYLVDEVRAGDMLEVHGPLGAFFVWAPDAAAAGDSDGDDTGGPAAGTRPVQLIAGGSGVVPLFAMAAARDAAGDQTPFRLLYSVRGPDDVYFSDELRRLAEASAPLQLDLVYTRRAPDGWPSSPARITREALEAAVVPAAERPRVFVCGSTGFVERVADWLVDLGHDARSIRTERYGGT
ncbi:FAD-binding oxidoreductase [Agromyces sp. Root1464]|uniref:FAD-binding oxidoreductase n=1 Tax=Agromyces sp. Root1464 TaxID=1736467 RepID=UPI000A8EBAD8